MSWRKNSATLGIAAALACVTVCGRVQAQGLGAAELANAYAAAIGATLILGPEAGTRDSYGYVMPDGHRYVVKSKSKTWWSQTRYAAGLVPARAAKLILPLEDNVLTVANTATGQEMVYVIVLDANPAQVLQQINQVEEALKIRDEVKKLRPLDYPLQLEISNLEAKLADAKSTPTAQVLAVQGDVDNAPAGGVDAVPATLKSRIDAHQAAFQAHQTILKKDGATADEKKKAGEAADAAWKNVEAWFSAHAAVLDHAASALAGK